MADRKIIFIRGTGLVGPGADLIKSHVKGYDRKDGTHVSEHDDKRTKKAEPGAEKYSHPHVVGKAELSDPYAEGPHDASAMKFAGTHYNSTGKSGKSFHDQSDVREFEADDGHRVWMDHHARVHADSQSEVEHLRAKGEAHAAEHAEKDEGGEEGGEKVDVQTILETALGKHNAAAGYISIPPATNEKILAKMKDMAEPLKSIGFGEHDEVPLNANGNGTLVLTNPAGQKVAISAQDAGDRHRISVSVHGGDDKPAAEADAAPGGEEGAEAPDGADKPAGGEKKPKAKAKPKPKAKPEGEGDFESLKDHPMHSESDLAYFKGKGYGPDDVKAIWDRDHAAGHKPVEHQKAPDVVGVAADPDHYRKKGGDMMKSLRAGLSLLVFGRANG